MEIKKVLTGCQITEYSAEEILFLAFPLSSPDSRSTGLTSTMYCYSINRNGILKIYIA